MYMVGWQRGGELLQPESPTFSNPGARHLSPLPPQRQPGLGHLALEGQTVDSLGLQISGLWNLDITFQFLAWVKWELSDRQLLYSPTKAC